jgi:FeS assembly SUF system regulator
MIRITRETDYGIVLLAHMARNSGLSFSAASLAKEESLPLPMVSKILKILARAGLLASQRGARGGYTLARNPEAISAAEIIGALEGPIAMTECSSDVPSTCVHQGHCSVSSHWHRINSAVRKALDNITLREMSQPPPAKVDFFRPRPIARPELTEQT